MNEMSNGAHARRALHARRGLTLAFFGGFAVTMAACPGPTPRTDTDGSGGEGSSTSSTSSTSSSSGGISCTTPGDCPAPESVCKTAICKDNTCGLEKAAAKTPCTEGGGKVCDGAGSCVACVEDVHCQTNISPNPCNGSLYTAPPTCKSGACEVVQPKDCGAEGLCSTAGCMPCAIDKDCGPPLGDCLGKQCVAGMCEKLSHPQGSECLPPAVGTCNAAGTCALRKYVFVTSKTYPPTFGSPKLADDLCDQIADGAKLGGTWKSWTSGGIGNTPWERFTQSKVLPYMLLNDQIIVAANWGGLTSGALLHGINLDENKQLVVDEPQVWTGTNEGGNYAGAACAGWTSTGMGGELGYVGTAGDITFGWTKTTKIACTMMARLYCFQQ